MKKALLALFLILYFSSFARAQQKWTLSASATTCTTSNTSCLIYQVDAASGGATFTVGANASANTLQFEATGDGGSTWVAFNVTPSNGTTAVTSTTSTGTWQGNVAGYTAVRIRMSTLVSGTATVSIITSLASARSGGGGGGLAPNTPGIPSQNGPGQIFAYNYGVLGDEKHNCYAVTVNATNTITVNQTGAQPTTADVGDIVFVTNGGCNGNWPSSSGGSVINSGFICGVAAGVITVGTTYPACAAKNSTATCTGNATTNVNCPINWGPRDDTTNLNTFFAAVDNFTSTTANPSCGDGVLPAGRAFVSSAIKVRNVFCGSNSAPGGDATLSSWSVHGGGAGTFVLVPLPSFDASTCVLSCFFDTPDNAVVGVSLYNIAVDGGGNSTVTNGTNKVAFNTQNMAGGGAYNLSVSEWGYSGTNNFTAFGLITNIGSWMDLHGLTAYNGGFRCATMTGAVVRALNCDDPVGVTVLASGVNSTSTTQQSQFQCAATFAQGGCVQVVQNGIWRSKDDLVDPEGFPSAIQCGGTCILDGTNVYCRASGTCHGIDLNDTTDSHAGTVYLHNAHYLVTGGVSIGGGVSGSAFFDQCGNIGFTGAVWTNISYTACPNGPESVGAIPTLSGTGACATITTQVPATTGGWSGSFKCTGTTGAATATITFGYTAPNGWTLGNAQDITTVADTIHQNSSTTTTIVLGAAAIAQNDVINWSAFPF